MSPTTFEVVIFTKPPALLVVSDFTSPFIDLSQFITSNPTNARGYEAQGILRLIQGKAPESEQDFNKSLALEPRLKDEIDRAVKNIKLP